MLGKQHTFGSLGRAGARWFVVMLAILLHVGLAHVALGFGSQNAPMNPFEPRHTFTDQEKDVESGLMYYGARYYHPTIGRFTQPDPAMMNPTKEMLANPQLLNPYSYAANNPMKFVDPSGETSVSALVFNPAATGLQFAFWNMASAFYLRTTGKSITADFLEHSLSFNPKPLNITAESKYSYVVDKIKESKEYNNFLDNQISLAEQAGKTYIDKTVINDKNKPEIKSIEFNTGDLSTSIHGTYSTHIIGSQEKGQWNIDTVINDRYDFKVNTKDYKDRPVLTAGNNLAVGSQVLETISKYNVTIHVSDKRAVKIKK